MLIQIYEVTSASEASALSRLAVDHIGVLVGSGSFPREQSLPRAREIFAGVQPGSKRCALSLSGDTAILAEIAHVLQPDVLHLGAAPEHLSPPDMARLKNRFPYISFMRSIAVVDESSLTLARAYDGIADWLLLDSHKAGDRQIGALGIIHDWELDRRIVESVHIPAVIAGGLGPENVAAAIRASHPAGVDSKTRTDRMDGSSTKDMEKVRAFVAAARRHDIC